jgi:hypothetical protein
MAERKAKRPGRGYFHIDAEPNYVVIELRAVLTWKTAFKLVAGVGTVAALLWRSVQ